MKLHKMNSNGKKEEKTFPCTYHGWVMIPLDLGGGKMLPYNDQSKMIKIGKKVATSQIAARSKGDKAMAVVHPSGVTVTADHPGNENFGTAAPLLSAAMETISCMLLSKDTGIAVVMAFTWDHTGARGVGCDVLKFGGKNPKKAIKTFGIHFSKAMEEQSRLAGAATQPIPSKPVDPIPLSLVPDPKMNQNTFDEEEDQIFSPVQLRKQSLSLVTEIPRRRRRSSAVNETETGYKPIDNVGGTNEGYLRATEAVDEEEDETYIMVRGRRSTNWGNSDIEEITGSPHVVNHRALIPGMSI